MPSSRERRNDAPLIQATPGAIAILAITSVLAIGLGLWALHDIGASLGEAGGKVGEIVSSMQSSSETPAPAPEATPVAPPAAPAASAERPKGALAQIRYAIEQCMPALTQLAEGARVIGVDISANGADLVYEIRVPGRFSRYSCEWGGASFNLSDSGRMVVPPRAGDPLRMPAKLIEVETLTANTIDGLVQRAAALGGVGVDRVKRVELAYTADSGELIRVAFDGARAVTIDTEGKRVQGAFFPRVERYREFANHDAADAAKLEGFRDTGEWTWSQGIAGSIDEITKAFEPSQRLVALEFTPRQVKATLPARGGVSEVLIDVYNDRGDPTPADRAPQHCSRPFGLGDARSALDVAMRARGETSAQFDEHTFEFAIYDCLENAKRPAWRFQ